MIELQTAEANLGCELPKALRDFYLYLGRQKEFTSAFQHFFEPIQWVTKGDKIVFLEENQGVCYWAVDAEEKVYQTSDMNSPEWYKEDVELLEFLHGILYYQMAQGGYPFNGMISSQSFEDLQDFQTQLNELDGRMVVNMDGLKIFEISDQTLIWYLEDQVGEKIPNLFISTLHEKRFNQMCDQWFFEDLS